MPHSQLLSRVALVALLVVAGHVAQVSASPKVISTRAQLNETVFMKGNIPVQEHILKNLTDTFLRAKDISRGKTKSKDYVKVRKVSGAGPLMGQCAEIADYLPSDCQCYEGSYGQFQVQCNMDFYYDQINLVASFNPCATRAEAEFEIKEYDLGVDYSTSYEAGQSMSYPIPGLTASILAVTAQVYLDVTIDGNAEDLAVSLAVDACATIPIYGSVCGADLTYSLPYVVMTGQYDFSGYCQQVALMPPSAPAGTVLN